MTQNQDEKKIVNSVTSEENKIKKEIEKPLIKENTDDKDIKILELEDKLVKAQKKEYENMLRYRAEIENIRRRSEKNIEQAHKFALEQFFNELLSVIDNLERSLLISDKYNNELSSFIEGIELTLKSLVKIVKKFGLETIEEINIDFNPKIHQAITVIDTSDHQSSKVISLIQKGYILNGRLLRPAMVVVSKKKI